MKLDRPMQPAAPMLRCRAAALLAVIWGAVFFQASPARADQVVQVPVDRLLNGRAVSTLTAGAVVPWTDGVDQNDGLMTTAAQAFLHQTGVALPDDGVFAADNRHPEVVLHFSNAAPVDSHQIFFLHGTGNFQFAVPPGHYSRLFLFLLSSIGASPLTVTFDYADATTTVQQFTLPDWGTGAPLPKDPPIFFNLIAGMHKWDRQDRSVDTPSHAITGVEVTPASDRVLTSVHVDKPNAGQYLTFWGATGVATMIADGGVASDGGEVDARVDAGVDVAVAAVDAGGTDTDNGAGGGAGGAGTGGGNAVDPATTDGGGGSSGRADGGNAPSTSGATGGCAVGGGASPVSLSIGFSFLAAVAVGVGRRRRCH
ncbi:MAG TPA: hypothetical protein VNO55_07855 [Polyangia bacterium]|nr:hypothetical protein [Polyangia bacterium]